MVVFCLIMYYQLILLTLTNAYYPPLMTFQFFVLITSMLFVYLFIYL